MACAAVAAAGCGRAPTRSVLARLVDADSGAEKRFDPASDLELSQTWAAGTSATDLPAWAFYVPAAAARVAPAGGIGLEQLANSRYLVWQGALAAANVDTLRLRFRQPLGGQVELYWSGEGEDFAPQRYALQQPDPKDPRQVTFALDALPTWRGTVTRVGVRVLPRPAEGQALLGMEGLRYVAGEAAGRGETKWVTLAGVTAPAWVARPESAIRRRVAVGPAARLELVVGGWLPPGASVLLRVASCDRMDGDPLWEHTLRQPADSSWRTWARAAVDLGPLAGRSVELCFGSGSAPPGSLVFWGNPRILARAKNRRPNVLFVSLDTVRADHLSLYGYERRTTPALAAFAARRATVFETVVASAPWTLPSHAAMLSGVDAIHHGVNLHGPIPSTLALLPERFRDAGYATYATTAGVLLTPELGFARGFDEFHVRGQMVSLPEWEAELRAGVDEAIGWLETHADERFFLFFHTYEAHMPYLPREPFFGAFGGRREALNGGVPVWMESDAATSLRKRYGLFLPENWAGGVTYPKRELQAQDRDLAVALYDAEIAHIDQQLSRLLAWLDAADMLDDTIVVITSDHGEAFFEHGLVGHGSLYDHDLLVPLVFASPLPESRGRRVASQVRSVDIAPTLLELGGLEPLPGLDGASLVPLLNGQDEAPRDAWSYALSTARGISLRTQVPAARKVIVQDTAFSPERDEVEVFDLASDGGEQRPVTTAGTDPALRRRLRERVVPGRAAIQVHIVNDGREAISGSLRGDLVGSTITSADLSFACCTFTAAGADFVAPPGSDFTLTLQDRPGGMIGVRLEAGGARWEGHIAMGAGPSRHRVSWSDGRWQPESRVAGALERGVDIYREAAQPAPAIEEEELRRRLRALGYVR